MFKSKKQAISAGFILLIFAIIILCLQINLLNSDIGFTLAEDTIAYYAAATESLSNQQNMHLIIDTFEILKTSKNEFRTTKQQDVTYLNRNSNDLQLSATESIRTGSLDLQASVTYCDNILYYTLNDSNFAGRYDPANLSAQYPHPVILDPNAYQNINGLHIGNSTIIRFSTPTQPETWAGIDDSFFTDACGYAWIDKTGSLVKSTYNFCYTKDDLIFYRSVTVRIADQDTETIAPPSNADDFLPLGDPMLPMQLELACGYLLQSQNLEANHTDTIICQLFGDMRIQNIDILIENGTTAPSLEMATSIDITNNSREGEVFTTKQVQRYSNGNYTLAINDAPAATDEVSSQELLANCQEILIGTILLPQHILDAKPTHTENTYRIEFAASDEFAQKIISDACTTLYNEPQLLDELTAEHRIDKVLCYLELDSESGLPVKSGIHFLGTYYSSELPYQLIFESDQTYFIP